MINLLIALGVIVGFVLLSLAVLAGVFGKLKMPTLSATAGNAGKFLAAVIALAIGNGLVIIVVHKLQLAGAQFDIPILFLGLNLCLAVPITLAFTTVPSSLKWAIGFLVTVVGLPVMVGLNTTAPPVRASGVIKSTETIDLYSKEGETEIFVLPGERSGWYRFQPNRTYGWKFDQGLVKVFNQATWKDGVVDDGSRLITAPDGSYDEKERTFSFLGLGKDAVRIQIWWKPNP